MAARHSHEVEVQLAHTAWLDEDALRRARALLDEVFGEEMTDEDWAHALGGVHALVWEQGELVAHGSVVQRRLLNGGRTLRAGYLEGVAVRAPWRGRGHATAVMEQLEGVIRGAYDLGALGASEMGARLYATRGWALWAGPTWALTPQGAIRTAQNDGEVFVLEVGIALDVSGPLTCDWREGELW